MKKKISDAVTQYSEKAQLDSFFQWYSDSRDFLAFSVYGKIRNFNEFEKGCAEYCKSNNLRKRFDSLCGFVTSELQMNALSGSVFIFINKKK